MDQRGAAEGRPRSVVEAAGTNLSKGQAPIRIAVTGRTVGPPLFESLVLLGRDEVCSRLRRAIARLDGG